MGLGSGFRVRGLGFRVQGSGFRVQGLGFRVWGSGFRVLRASLPRDVSNLPPKPKLRIQILGCRAKIPSALSLT